jgi:hypothetical protein
MPHGTPYIPRWYIKFQTAVLEQLPRPDEISKEEAEGWRGQQGELRETLLRTLVTQEAPSQEHRAVPNESLVRHLAGLKLTACFSMFCDLVQPRDLRYRQFLNRSFGDVVTPCYFDGEERFPHTLNQSEVYRVYVFEPSTERTTLFRAKMREVLLLHGALSLNPLDAALVWYDCLSDYAERLPRYLRFYDFRHEGVPDAVWKQGAPCVENIERSRGGQCRLSRAPNKPNQSLSLPQNHGLVVVTKFSR